MYEKYSDNYSLAGCLSKKNCKFYRESIEFRGFVIGRGFIQMDPKKVELVASWLIPSCLEHL